MSNDTEVVHYEDRYYRIVGGQNKSNYVSTANGTMCVPLTDSGMVIFIIEPSSAFDKDILCLPGGQVDPNETIEACANRELQEEIGYKSLKLDYLAELHPWEKYLDLRAFIYLARDLVPSKLAGDELYQIKTEIVPLDDFETLIANKRIQDSTVIAALYMARAYLQSESD